MRIVRVDRKKNLIEVVPEEGEDLWLLSLLLTPGDVVEGTVTRRIKREDERGSGKLFTFRVKLAIEGVEFTGSSLRIKGVIEEGPEDLVGKGKHQNMEVRVGEKIRIYKKEWNESMVEEIRRAEKATKVPPVLIVSLSDEDATMAPYHRRLGTFRTVRRRSDEESLRTFFGEVAKAIEESPEDIVVVGGPSVIVDEFRKFLEDKGSKKRVSYVVSPLRGEKGVKDILSKRASHIIADERRRAVESLIEEFLVHLSKGDGLASLKPEEDAEMGNLRVLLVHEDWIRGERERAHTLTRRAHDIGAQVFLVKDDYEGEAVVRKLGGRIGIRRYPLN